MKRKFLPDCPVEVTMLFMGSREKIMILAYLLLEEKTFDDLLDNIENISRKDLEKYLIELKEDGFIEEKQGTKNSNIIIYYISEEGKEFKQIIECMNEWGKNRY